MCPFQPGWTNRQMRLEQRLCLFIRPLGWFSNLAEWLRHTDSLALCLWDLQFRAAFFQADRRN